MSALKWTDERPAHGVVLMNGTMLLCSCGMEIHLTGADLKLSQRIQYDLLLDRHSLHKKRQRKK
jgi:hypothetical protein